MTDPESSDATAPGARTDDLGRRAVLRRVAALALGSLTLGFGSLGAAVRAHADDPSCAQTDPQTGLLIADGGCGSVQGPNVVESDVRCTAVGGEGEGVYADDACGTAAQVGSAGDRSCGAMTGDPASLREDMNCGSTALGAQGTIDKDTDCGSGMGGGAGIISEDDACGSHGVSGAPAGSPEADERCTQLGPDNSRYNDGSCGVQILGYDPPMVQGDNDCAFVTGQGSGASGDQDCGLGSLSTGHHSDAACVAPGSGDDDCGVPHTGGGAYNDGYDPS